jgi:hypothetical protein
LGKWTAGITTKTGNKAAINVIQQNQVPSPQNTTERNTKNVKMLHIICILLEQAIRKKTGIYKQK